MNSLEKLEELVRLIYEHKSNTYNELMNYLRDVRISLKALEIIKKKRVDINKIYYAISFNCDLNWYNNQFAGKEDSIFALTQEEFDLLKKELEK